jgi:hypothetical protein
VFRRDPKRRSSAASSRERSSDERPSGGKASRTAARGSSGDPAEADRSSRQPDERFILYVEGARDREILAGWARHVAPVFGRTLERSTVILGGRQPARAVHDFRRRGGAEAGIAGLVVLDRDDHHDDRPGARPLEPGLELFIWSLRHIESYLLVPAAIRRIAPHAPDDRTLLAWIDRHESEDPRADVAPKRRVGPHAKRMLGAGGALGESLGVELRAGEIAKAMRRDELHPDVHDLFARVAALRGVAPLPSPSGASGASGALLTVGSGDRHAD